MSATHSLKALLILALVLVTGVPALLAQDSAALENPLEVDVAEDGNRFVFTSERLFDDGMPQYGTPFVTQGYLYPAGTLNGSDGVRPDGQPEFPALVIGEWTCYGWMIGDGAHTTTGEWVVSTQIYQFDEAHGGGILITDGFELADIGVEGIRAITGGSGQFVGVSGTQAQTLLGFTAQMGVNLNVRFDFAGVTAAQPMSKPADAPSQAPVYSWDGLAEPEVIAAREAAAAPNISGSAAPVAFHSWDGLALPEVIAAREAAAAPSISGSVVAGSPMLIALNAWQRGFTPTLP